LPCQGKELGRTTQRRAKRPLSLSQNREAQLALAIAVTF